MTIIILNECSKDYKLGLEDKILKGNNSFPNMPHGQGRKCLYPRSFFMERDNPKNIHIIH